MGLIVGSGRVFGGVVGDARAGGAGTVEGVVGHVELG